MCVCGKIGLLPVVCQRAAQPAITVPDWRMTCFTLIGSVSYSAPGNSDWYGSMCASVYAVSEHGVAMVYQ